MPITSRFAAAAARAYGMFSNLARAVDPFFNYVTALLHGDGTNGAQNNTFLDSSTNNFTITRNGNTTQGTFSPFSQTGWSNYFDGTANYAISAPAGAAFAFGTGDFTVEGWIYTTNLAGENFIFDTRSSASTAGMGFSIEPSTGKLRYSGSANNVLTSVGITANTWYHVAWVRSGTTLTGYINGVNCGTATNSDNITQNNGVVGRVAFSTASSTGYLSNVRVVKGTAVYTSNFTPSTTPLTAISGTSLLTCQANRFLDASSNAFAITVTGSPTVQAFSPFNPTSAWSASSNGGSGYFDGSGDYLFAASNAAFGYGTGDFTIEMWVYPTVISASTPNLLDQRTSNPQVVPTIYLNAGVLSYYVSGANRITGATLIAGQWYHIALCRASGSTKLFLNGVQTGSTYADINNYITSPVTVFVDGTGGGTYQAGYCADLRIVKGTALYTTTFTPPTAPLTAITNTSLLLNYTNAGIYDNAAKNDYETVGNAQVSTSVVKYGTGSMYFDGTGDYLAPPAGQNYVFGTGDFTIECWVYPTTFSAYRAIIDSRAVTTNNTGFLLSLGNATTGAWAFFKGSTAIVSASTNLTLNIWQHVAVTRVAGKVTLYLNGTSVGSATDSQSFTDTVCRIGSTVDGISWFGYIDDLRVTKGVGRYPYNFTPPTTAFPNIGGTVTPTSDQYYNYTTLLLPGNGTNGAQNNTFLDSSSNAFTITRNGNTTQGTFTPFSQTGWGNYLNGSSYLNTGANAAFAMGTGDFTWECWVNVPASGAYQVFIDTRTSPGYADGYYFGLNTGTLNPAVFKSTAVLTSTTAIPTNQWVHMALVRLSGTITIYMNGTNIGSVADTTNLTNNTLGIGSLASTLQNPLTGYISNVRITKGGALYTANFTPSTTPLTTTVSAGTVSLLTCQSNRFLDNSANSFAITVNGSPSVQAFSPFAPTAAYSASTVGGSGYFDGSGDYLSLASNAAFAVAGQYTVEFWAYQTAAPTNYASYFLVNVSNGLQIGFNTAGGGVFGVANNLIGWQLTTAAFPLNAWTHIAITRDASNVTRIFYNGVLQTSGTITTSYTQGATVIGFSGPNNGYITGYVSDMRFVNGTAVYTANFTPPTAPLAAITNTQLLLSYTNGAITDATAKNDLETVGNAQISTTQSKFGGSSMYFDGTNSKAVMRSLPNMNMGSGDFTVECWVYWAGTTTLYQNFVGSNDTFTSNACFFRVWGSGVVGAGSVGIGNPTHDGTSSVYVASALTANTWTHVAATRYNGIIRVFINGVLRATGSSDTSTYDFGQGGTCVGASPWDGANGWYSGYIDDLRITKGIARYTSNFTPPTSAFLLQ